MPPSAPGAFRERPCGDRRAQPECRPDAPWPARSRHRGNVATSSAQVLNVARKPWAVIGAKQAPNPAWLLWNMELLQACRLGVYLPPPRRSRLRRRSWCSLWALPSHGRWQDSNAVVHRAPSSAANVRVECQCWGRAGPLRGSAKMLGRLIEWLRRRKPPLDERKRIIRKSSERGDGEPDIDPLDELVRLVGDAQADERTAHPFAPIERNFRERFAGRGDEVAI
jgi:hypothetical protein